MSFENNFCFLSILGYQTRFLVSKIENYFWKLKIRRKNGYQTYPYFHSMRLQKHLEWHGATRSEIGALKVPLSAKMTKAPLVNPGLAEIKTRSNYPQNSTLHSFTSNPSFSKIFGKFNQVWLGVDSRGGLKTLILIRPSEWVEPDTIANIIKFSFLLVNLVLYLIQNT